jgi:hypothetical protein
LLLEDKSRKIHDRTPEVGLDALFLLYGPLCGDSDALQYALRHNYQRGERVYSKHLTQLRGVAGEIPLRSGPPLHAVPRGGQWDGSHEILKQLSRPVCVQRI